MAKKIKPGPAPVWELPHGKGQGPRPGDHTLPPLKKAKGKVKGKYGKPFSSDIG